MKQIIKKIAKYGIAILASLYAWTWAAQSISAKDDLAVIAGIILFAIIASAWVWLIESEFNSVENNK